MDWGTWRWAEAYDLTVNDHHTYYVHTTNQTTTALAHNCPDADDLDFASGALERRLGSVDVQGKAKQTELDYANVLAGRGFDVGVRGTSAPGADLLINGVEYELKTLTSSTQTSVIRNVRRGLAQSDRVIINGAPSRLTHANAVLALDRLKGAGHLSGAAEVVIETATGRVVWTP